MAEYYYLVIGFYWKTFQSCLKSQIPWRGRIFYHRSGPDQYHLSADRVEQFVHYLHVLVVDTRVVYAYSSLQGG